MKNEFQSLSALCPCNTLNKALHSICTRHRKNIVALTALGKSFSFFPKRCMMLWIVYKYKYLQILLQRLSSRFLWTIFSSIELSLRIFFEKINLESFRYINWFLLWHISGLLLWICTHTHSDTHTVYTLVETVFWNIVWQPFR